MGASVQQLRTGMGLAIISWASYHNVNVSAIRLASVRK